MDHTPSTDQGGAAGARRRRPLLASLTTLGVVTGLLGVAGVFAAGSDSATTGQNDATSGDIEVYEPSVDLQLATATYDGGAPRELIRLEQPFSNHNGGQLSFNPLAQPNSPDFGLLYMGVADGGSGGDPLNNAQKLSSAFGKMFRIDPLGKNSTNGKYGIPKDNPYANDNDPNTLGEIYAYGFRNAHRVSWDTDGTMFASDIGMNQIEEVNIVRNGENYGWMTREGYWENGRWRGGQLRELFPLAADVLNGKTKDGFTYPVAMYDHDEGRAVTAGFAYRGRIAALRDKFVFGDIQNGRLFASDLAAMKKADDGIPHTVAPVEEIQLFVRGAEGRRTYVAFRELIEMVNGTTATRADLHISRTRDGELLLTSRQDGMIRMLVPDSSMEQ